MPLRKLLCESNSVLLNVCPDFEMPPLAGFPITLEDSQVLVRQPYETNEIVQWITIKEWLEQSISWFDRDVNSMVEILP